MRSNEAAQIKSKELLFRDPKSFFHRRQPFSLDKIMKPATVTDRRLTKSEKAANPLGLSNASAEQRRASDRHYRAKPLTLSYTQEAVYSLPAMKKRASTKMNISEQSGQVNMKKLNKMITAATTRSRKGVELRDSFKLFTSKTRSIDKAQNQQMMETQRFIDSIQNTCRDNTSLTY